MYTSFSIENFRLFDQLTVEPLARVNLIAGKNNVGKTALLEALWLHSGQNNPERARRINFWRGLNSIEPIELLSNLFYEYQTNSPIILKAHGSWGDGLITLVIARRRRSEQFVAVLSDAPEIDLNDDTYADFDFRNEVIFEYKDQFDDKWSSTARLDEESALSNSRPNLRISGQLNNLDQPMGVFVYPDRRFRPQPYAAKFGRAELGGYLPQIEDLVRSMEPRLKRLTAIPNDRGLPLIFADTGIGRLLPVALMGEGVRRLLTLALDFLPARDGIIFIDEVENGLHHSVLPDVWKNLQWLSQEFNVQVFATTHSYDCIVAANDAFGELESNELHLHRLYSQDDQVKVATYDKEALDTNIEYLWELR